MTEAQWITIATVFFATVGALLCNNSRVSDLQSGMDGRFTGIDKRFDDMNRHIDDKFSLLSLQMKNMEENIMRVLGDHETRLQSLEKRRDR